jgi:cytochrome c5
MRYLLSLLLLVAVAGPAFSGDFCKVNKFTRAQAVKGRWAFDSSCGLCHLYSLRGRLAGESSRETPDISILPVSWLVPIDRDGGNTPSLISDTFFAKWKDEQAFADRIANATGAFPPKGYVKDISELEIAAYILYERCGKL